MTEKSSLPETPSPASQFTDDNFYHQFFSNAEVVADLLKIINPDLLNELDLSSFTQVSNEFISADMRARRGDVFWKVRWKAKDTSAEDGWLYIYILLEFKSRQERFCILQVLEYLILAYRDLIKKKALTANHKLPPLLPIVLYNGDTPWKQPKTLAELIEPGPAFFQPFVPNFNLFVIDENDYQDAPLEINNLVSAIFKFENSRDPFSLKELIEAFLVWFNAHPNQALKQAIITWIKHSLKNVLSPDILGQIHTLEELSPMFATRAEQFMQQQKTIWLQTGMETGEQKGRQEGREEERRALLIKTLSKRFGPIPEFALSVIQTASLERLEFLIDCALEAASLDEWLAKVAH